MLERTRRGYFAGLPDELQAPQSCLVSSPKGAAYIHGFAYTDAYINNGAGDELTQNACKLLIELACPEGFEPPTYGLEGRFAVFSVVNYCFLIPYKSTC
jgi:hypothetical protein